MTDSRAGLALLGGAFNPPHRTHVRIVQAALAQLPIAELWVVPSGDHPHKDDGDMASAAHRLAMCRLAFEGIDRVAVHDLEIARGGTSYTVETLARLHREQPGRALWFVLGADNLPLLPTWREHHRILQLANVVTLPRRGFPIDATALAALDFTASERRALLEHALAIEPDAVNATELRAHLRAGARQLADLSPAVEEYVRHHHLYGS